MVQTINQVFIDRAAIQMSIRTGVANASACYCFRHKRSILTTYSDFPMAWCDKSCQQHRQFRFSTLHVAENGDVLIEWYIQARIFQTKDTILIEQADISHNIAPQIRNLRRHFQDQFWFGNIRRIKLLDNLLVFYAYILFLLVPRE